MKPSERRKQMKEEMAQRMQESYNSKDDSGRYKPIFVKSKLGNIPKWKCQEGEHFINIIPFISGKQNPNVAPGSLAYMLDIWAHGKVGINEDSFVCLQRSYGRPCPICEAQAEIRKQENYDEKFVKSMNPSRRVVYNIECLDSTTEIAKKLQYWEVSHFLFEKELSEVAKKPKGGGFVLFAHPDEGKQIFFRKSGSGPTNTKYSGFQFMDRTAPISDELLDSALCLDEMIHIPTYEEVYNAYNGIEISEEEQEEVEQRVDIRQPIQFECPGNSPDDYGQFDICDECPDMAICEQGFEELQEASESEKSPVPTSVAAPPVTSPPTATVSRRTSTRPTTSVAPTTQERVAETSGRRIRHRQGA